MSFYVHIDRQIRMLHIVAVLADRKDHTIYELTIVPTLTSTWVSNMSTTRTYMHELIAAGYVVVSGRMAKGTVETGQTGARYLYRLADRTGGGIDGQRSASAQSA